MNSIAGVASMTVAMKKQEVEAFEKLKNKVKQKAQLVDCHDKGRLAKVKNLEDAFAMFGFFKGDRVRLRDRVVIYNRVVDAMEAKLSELRSQNAHMAAKEQHERLNLIKREYEKVFRDDERLRGQDEMKNLDKALGIEIERHEKRAKKLRIGLEEKKMRKRKELEELHTAQTLDLEHRIKRMPRPRFRMSTRMLNMTIGEKHLAKLGEYKPAQDLRNMILKLQPREQAQFRREYEQKLERMREKLKKEQQFDRERLREALDRIEWAGTRTANKAEETVRQRLKNNTNDMHHAHTLQMHHKPQKTAKPTIEKRLNHSTTSSYFRGQQMLARLVGKKEHAIPSLCSLHDFKDEPMGTVQYYHSKKSAFGGEETKQASAERTSKK
eukprot:g1192.t1